ncbi:nucleoside hydrolase [Aneurinibacillus sp. REN35]|uniref:nucleoside hydrolase n=1 Tax=Aneurinibacillus sp. REN35 TaxID=3237286 RepID=UPI003528185A
MKPVILDVDTGIDDAMAIGYALNAPELDVIGITTCFGNGTVEHTTRNTLQVLDLFERAHIPVYPGASAPLVREAREAPIWIHGSNGLADITLAAPTQSPKNIPAHEFLIASIKERPGDVTVIATGSLTNIAIAIKKAPEIVPLMKELIIMGGAVHVPGNVTPYAEANIYADPEAAEIVLQSGARITLIGLDVTMQAVLKESQLAIWQQQNTPASAFLAEACAFYMNAYRISSPELGGCALHDPLAVGVAIDPTFVTTSSMPIYVDTTGDTLGQTKPLDSADPTRERITVCTDVAADRFVEHFLQRTAK